MWAKKCTCDDDAKNEGFKVVFVSSYKRESIKWNLLLNTRAPMYLRFIEFGWIFKLLVHTYNQEMKMCI